MKKIMLALSVLLVPFLNLSLSHADQLAPVDTSVAAAMDANLIGAWKSTRTVYKDKNVSVFLGMEFKEGTAIMSSICGFPNRKVLEAAVEVPVNVADGKIEVVSRGQAQVVDGGLRCEVAIEPGIVAYKVNGRNLRLTNQGQNLDFVRR